MYQCKFIQQIACLKWFGLIFCYIFKLNHTPSYEKKNDRKCSRVPMNTGSHLCLFFFSSECHQRPMYGQSGEIAYFGTRVPKNRLSCANVFLQLIYILQFIKFYKI